MLNSMKTSVWTIALCVLLPTLVPTALKASEEKVKLVFKISGKTDKIQIISKERVCTTPQKGERFSSEVRSKKIVVRKSFRTGDNEITTKFKTTKMKVTVNGKEAPSLEPFKETSTKADRLGNKIPEKGETGESFLPNLNLILPKKAVKPGDSWDTTTKPSKGYPASLKMTFKLNKIEDLNGVKCAVIQAKCFSDEVFKDRYVKSHLSIRNRIYFDIKAGKVIKNTSQTQFILTWLKTLKGLPLQRATFSTTSMTISKAR